MAEQALKSIPNKELKKIVRGGKLSALVSSVEGKHFFDSYMKNPDNPHPEFVKYWDFYELVAALSTTAGGPDQQLELADQCYSKHIAIEADSGNRIDSLLDRNTVKDIRKTLATCKQESASPVEAFLALQKSSLEHLDQHIFRPYLVPVLDEEKKKRLSIECGLS